jgi:malonyl CoA-acyl carrier protein transacylase
MRALILREAVGREKLLELCEVVSKQSKLIALANWNTDTQVVSSGYNEGLQHLDSVVGKDEWKWVRRSIPLEVSGPFHSSSHGKGDRKISPPCFGIIEFFNFKIKVQSKRHRRAFITPKTKIHFSLI